MGLTVRGATRGDANVVAEILDECTRHFFNRPSTINDAVSRLNEGDGAIALLDGRAAGFGHAWLWSDDEARAFVRVRRRSAGSRCSASSQLRAAAVSARRSLRTVSRRCDRGLRVAALNVDAENTSGALRLYRKAGMESQPSFTIYAKQCPALRK